MKMKKFISDFLIRLKQSQFVNMIFFNFFNRKKKDLKDVSVYICDLLKFVKLYKTFSHENTTHSTQ